jgi:hypothetical protein
VPPDIMLQWRSFSCGVRSRSVATRAAPSRTAIQQTQIMIMTHAPRVGEPRRPALLSAEFTHSSVNVVASLVLSCDGGHTATVRHSFGRHHASDSVTNRGRFERPIHTTPCPTM